MKNSLLIFKNTQYIDPKKLILNVEKFSVLGKCKNYEELYESIENEGIITPLLVNESNTVVSGNLRLCIALELKLKLVPITYTNIEESNIIKMLHTDIYREKTMTEKLMIYFFLKEKYQIPKGGRTDLNQKLKEKKKLFDEFNPFSVHQTKTINGYLEDYTPGQIKDSFQEIEDTGKVIKIPMVTNYLKEKHSIVPKDIEEKYPTPKPVFNLNDHLTIDYGNIFKLENLKDEVSHIQVIGGSVFISNVPKDKDWKLIKEMKTIGLILYTFKCVSIDNYTYHFVFVKSEVPPVKQLENLSFSLNTFNEYRLSS
jgi:hypothetical protein